MTDLLTLLGRKAARPLLFLVGVYMIIRAASAINPHEAVTYFSKQAQPAGKYFDIEVPKLAMSVAWPIIYALLNSLHERIKVVWPVFLIVIIAHVASIGWGAWLLFTNPPVTGKYGTLTGRALEQAIVDAQLISGGTITLTVLSGLLALWIYRSGISLFVADRSAQGVQEPPRPIVRERHAKDS